MMKRDKELENILIDRYYNENQESDIKYNLDAKNSVQDYQDALQKSMSSMDLIKNLDFDFDINLMGIIEKAEKIKLQKKYRFELLGFIVVCFLILSTIVLIALNLDIKVLIYSELLFSAVLPLIVIPISRNSKAKGEV